MAAVNTHGLSRHIPAEIRRTVRQRDGFGCVVCGSAIYTYEHVDPSFAEAGHHDADCITLLCAGCHGRVTTGMLSKTTVTQAMADPKCRRTGFSFGPFDIGPASPSIRVGPVTAHEVAIVIRAMGDDILKVEPPEETDGPFRISALLANATGTEMLRIDRNEWATSISNWDVQVQGPKITIHNAPGDVALVLRANPPSGIVVERLDMFHKGMRLTVREQVGLTVRTPSGFECTTTEMEFRGCEVAVDVSEDGSIGLGLGGGSLYIGSMVTGTASASSSPRARAPRRRDTMWTGATAAPRPRLRVRGRPEGWAR